MPSPQTPVQRRSTPVHTAFTQYAFGMHPFGSTHGVLSLFHTLAGHALEDPLQTSAISQLPAAGLQTVLFGFFESEGQKYETPSQTSAISHGPAEALHTV